MGALEKTVFPELPLNENARERRARVLKQGFAAWSGHFSAVECTIRDMTEGGARLVFNDLMVVPSRFDLIIPIDGNERSCEIAWTKGNICGVKFIGLHRKCDLARRTQVLNAYRDKGEIAHTSAKPNGALELQLQLANAFQQSKSKAAFGKRHG